MQFTGIQERKKREKGRVRQGKFYTIQKETPNMAMGQRLLGLLPNSRLHIVHGGEHDFAVRDAARVAPLIDQYLGGT